MTHSGKGAPTIAELTYQDDANPKRASELKTEKTYRTKAKTEIARKLIKNYYSGVAKRIGIARRKQDAATEKGGGRNETMS